MSLRSMLWSISAAKYAAGRAQSRDSEAFQEGKTEEGTARYVIRKWGMAQRGLADADPCITVPSEDTWCVMCSGGMVASTLLHIYFPLLFNYRVKQTRLLLYTV